MVNKEANSMPPAQTRCRAYVNAELLKSAELAALKTRILYSALEEGAAFQ